MDPLRYFCYLQQLLSMLALSYIQIQIQVCFLWSFLTFIGHCTPLKASWMETTSTPAVFLRL